MHDVDTYEDALIDRFRSHPVLANITRLPEADFAEVLLQRRFVSLAFTPAYDLAIDLLEDETARQIARVILREEYPGSHGRTRSHREDMVEDMLRLGISRRRVVTSRPTAATLRTVEETFALIASAGGHPDSDLRVLTVLRFWGEVLVATEYERLWERMSTVLATSGDNRSVFYHPHLLHDAKTLPLAAAAAQSATHADALASRIAGLLAQQPSAEVFQSLEAQALRLKTAFYDQFLPAVDRLPALDRLPAGSR